MAAAGQIICSAAPARDRLWGDKGNDWLDGGLGNDVLRGGGGRDTFVLSAGNDVLNGGGGKDMLDASGYGSGIRVNLTASKQGYSSDAGPWVYLAANTVETKDGLCADRRQNRKRDRHQV